MNGTMCRLMNIIKERHSNYDIRMQRAIWLDTMTLVHRYCIMNDWSAACNVFIENFGEFDNIVDLIRLSLSDYDEWISARNEIFDPVNIEYISGYNK